MIFRNPKVKACSQPRYIGFTFIVPDILWLIARTLKKATIQQDVRFARFGDDLPIQLDNPLRRYPARLIQQGARGSWGIGA
jgi:hypothetical protein